MRIETFGAATLILGDCRDAMQGTTADHVIGDPPYEDEIHVAAKARRITRTDGGASTGDFGFDGVNADRQALAAACVEASSGWLILFTLAEGVRAWRDAIQAAGGKWDATGFWVKPDARPRMNGQGPARGAECMAVAWAGRGHRSWNAGGKRGIYTHMVNGSARQGEHPTEKPVALMSEIVSDFTRPGQTILDPFMGSGSTGVACLALGRRFVGIERDPKWFDLACRRLDAADRQPRLFEPEEKPARTPPLFAASELPTARPAKGV